MHQAQHQSISSSSSSSAATTSAATVDQSHKINDYIRSGGIESLETLSSSNKDLLALHNGAWANQETKDGMLVGQDKIIRAFSELMRNITRMKTFIRPSMCKPYGKQSESLQKSKKIIEFLVFIQRNKQIGLNRISKFLKDKIKNSN